GAEDDARVAHGLPELATRTGELAGDGGDAGAGLGAVEEDPRVGEGAVEGAVVCGGGDPAGVADLGRRTGRPATGRRELERAVLAPGGAVVRGDGPVRERRADVVAEGGLHAPLGAAGDDLTGGLVHGRGRGGADGDEAAGERRRREDGEGTARAGAPGDGLHQGPSRRSDDGGGG